MLCGRVSLGERRGGGGGCIVRITFVGMGRDGGALGSVGVVVVGNNKGIDRRSKRGVVKEEIEAVRSLVLIASCLVWLELLTLYTL